jgi:8-oxo-dGTP pyrophosphatase MutT (NUDIX family)
LVCQQRGEPNHYLAGLAKRYTSPEYVPVGCVGVADNPLNRSRAYVAAGVLFFDDVGRVLLVQPTYKNDWDIPGGYVETGETPVQAAAREVQEELGIETAIGPLLVADWAPNPHEGDKLLLVFDGGTLTAEQLAAIHLQADELASYAFHDPAAETTALLIPHLRRRMTAAVDAHQAGRPTYLEQGVPHAC